MLGRVSYFNLFRRAWPGRRMSTAVTAAAGFVLVVSFVGMVIPVWGAPPAIYLEDSPAAQEQVDRALALREQGRLTDAVEQLHRVTLEYPHKLMQVEPGRYEDALRWVRRRLREDKALLAAYRRAYGGEAERHRREAMEPAPDSKALEQVVARYAMTEPGLKAGLTLAALYLERADVRSAASVLDELQDHPDLEAASDGAPGDEKASEGTYAQRYHYLQVVAGIFTEDAARRDSHRQYFQSHHDAQHLEALTQLAQHFEPPGHREANERMADQQVTVSLEPGRAPLWEAPVAWAPFGSPNAELTANRANRRDDDAPVSIQPTADATRVYLNQGDRLRALDRDSGAELWTYRWKAVEALGDLPAVMRMQKQGNEQRGVLVRGRRLYAVMGKSLPWMARLNEDAVMTSLVCLSTLRGQLCWQVTSKDLNDELSDTDFIGTPAAGDDCVFSLVRRSQPSGFKDTFLVAISQADGSLVWQRHIASSAMASRYSTGPQPRLVVFGGLVCVVDNLGAVAAVDHRTGMMRWVRLLVEPQWGNGENAGIQMSQQVDDTSMQPVQLAAGLIVHKPLENAMAVLDPQTGRERQTLNSEPWSTARAMLPAGDDVLLVGQKLTLIDGQSLKPRWEHAFANEPPVSPTGQIAVTANHVFCVADDHLYVLDLKTGERQDERRVETPANVLPLDGQVVLVSAEHVRSYMSWQRAADRLRQRIEQSPADPSPGMALAHSRLRNGQREAVLEGVGHALAALREVRRPCQWS